MRRAIWALILLMVPVVWADSYTDSFFHPASTNATYYTPADGVTCTNLTVNATCLIITGGTYSGTFCNVPIASTNYTLCDASTDCQAGDVCSGKLCTVYISPTAPAGGGGGGGSCPTYMKEFHGYCTDEGIMQGFVFDRMSGKICTGKETSMKLRVIDDDGVEKVVQRVFLRVGGKEYNFAVRGNAYVLDAVIDAGNMTGTFIAIDEILGVQYNIQYDQEFQSSECYAFVDVGVVDSIKTELGDTVSDLKDMFIGWSTYSPEERTDTLKKHAGTIVVVFGLLIVSFIVYDAVFKKKPKKEEE